MIITVTLDPVLEVIHTMPRFSVEEGGIAERSSIIAGGHGIYLSNCLKAFDIESWAMFFSGGETGLLFEQLLNEKNMEYESVTTKAPVRITSKIQTGETSFRINTASEVIAEKEADAFLERFCERVNMGDCVLLAGPLPKGLPLDFYGTLADIVKDHGAICMGEGGPDDLIPLIKRSVFMIKIDEDTAMELYGDRIKTPQQGINLCRRIHEQGVNTVILTLNNGEILYSANQTAYYIRSHPETPYPYERGEPDGFIAGFAGAMALGLSSAECVKMATAFRNCALTSPFDQRSLEKVLKWAKRTEMESL